MSAMNEAEKSYWVKQVDGWVQGSLIYTHTTGTATGQMVLAQPEPGLLFPTNAMRGNSMSWDAVDFLLLRLGFTRTLYPDYAMYTYKDLTPYKFLLYTKGGVSQWTDSQVREIFVYAHLLITAYEEEHAAAAPVQLPAPKPEFEAEDW